MHRSGIKKLTFLQYIRESARIISTPITVIVDADPKIFLSFILHGSNRLHWSAVTNVPVPRHLLELHVALEHAARVQIESSHGQRGWPGGETVLRLCSVRDEMRTKGQRGKPPKSCG